MIFVICFSILVTIISGMEIYQNTGEVNFSLKMSIPIFLGIGLLALFLSGVIYPRIYTPHPIASSVESVVLTQNKEPNLIVIKEKYKIDKFYLNNENAYLTTTSDETNTQIVFIDKEETPILKKYSYEYGLAAKIFYINLPEYNYEYYLHADDIKEIIID